MNSKKINNPSKELRILIAPLDWGLGHITRCIPIIYALKNTGATLFLAGDITAEAILKKEFPELPFLPLKGYNILYSKDKMLFLLKLFSQFSSIKRTIQYEQKWLQKVVAQYNIDAVISDNRFGLYHNHIPSVYITHQLNIETGNWLLNIIAQKIHYHYINRYNECWVPDAQGENSLAGKLSLTKKRLGIPVKYLGTLSRFTKKEVPVINDLLIILSGPEPQRTIFENIILSQLNQFSGNAILVRGLPVMATPIAIKNSVQIFNYLPADNLNLRILQSKMVLSRSGYTTIMDLSKLQQKAILVPTPGQTEQEYLAVYTKQQGKFYSCEQKNFNVEKALKEAQLFYKNKMASPSLFHTEILEDWVAEIKKQKALQ